MHTICLSRENRKPNHHCNYHSSICSEHNRGAICQSSQTLSRTTKRPHNCLRILTLCELQREYLIFYKGIQVPQDAWQRPISSVWGGAGCGGSALLAGRDPAVGISGAPANTPLTRCCWTGRPVWCLVTHCSTFGLFINHCQGNEPEFNLIAPEVSGRRGPRGGVQILGMAALHARCHKLCTRWQRQQGFDSCTTRCLTVCSKFINNRSHQFSSVCQLKANAYIYIIFSLMCWAL